MFAVVSDFNYMLAPKGVTAMIYYGCPGCQAPMASPDGMAGQNETCPACGNVTLVPRPAAATVAPTPIASPAVQIAQGRPVVKVVQPKARGTSGFGVAALVLGIVACLTCWIPLLSILSIPISALGLLFACLGFVVSLLGRRSSIGMPFAGGIVCGVAIFVAGATSGVVNRAFELVEEAERASQGGAGPAKPGPVIQLGQKHAWDGRALTVVSARVGKVAYKSFMSQDMETDEEYFVVELEASNTTTNEKFKYYTFRDRETSFLADREEISLTDSKGNVYDSVSVGSKNQPTGAVSYLESLYPGKSVRDILVFEAPIKGNGPYRLALPLSKFDGEGFATWEIPESALKR